MSSFNAENFVNYSKKVLGLGMLFGATWILLKACEEMPNFRMHSYLSHSTFNYAASSEPYTAR